MKAPQLVRFHPHTGDVLRPVYVTKRGRVVWPILGASDDDAPGPDDLTDPDADDSDDDSDDSEDSDDEKDKKPKDDEDGDSDSYWKEKYDKLMNRMKGADQRSSRLEKEMADLRKSGMDKAQVDEELRKENSKLIPQVEKLSTDNKALRLQVAFLQSNDVSWVNPEVALKLADLSDVDIDDETGKVDTRALRAALKQLARDHKYLVKPAATNEDTGDDSGASTGSKMNGKRKGDKGGGADRKALAKRFPALNSGL